MKHRTYVEIPIRDCHVAAPWRRLLVLGLRRRGWKVQVIADWMGVTHQRVYHILNNNPQQPLSSRELTVGGHWIRVMMQRAKAFEQHIRSGIGE